MMEPKKTRTELLQIAEALQTLSDSQKFNKLSTIFPDKGKFARDLYVPHMDFMKAGRTHRFRAFMGGNRSGKSMTGAVEMVYHLTGLYPEWWKGKVQKKPKTWWVLAESGALYRDSMQILLFGEPGEPEGTGLIPKDCIVKINAMPGITGAIGSAIIKHKSGHTVSLIVKTYEMSRENFQAAKVSGILMDEEPPENLYTECLMRLMGAGDEPGIAMLLFTPLKGYSSVILKYLVDGRFPIDGTHPDKPESYVCRVEWDQVPHLSAEDKATLLSEIPANEREARTKGLPSLGSGRVYPVMEEDIVISPFKIPDHFKRVYGLDFGWHCTACIWAAQDPATKTIYLYSEYYKGKVAPYVHAQAIKSRGSWIPGVADPSGGGRNAGDGTLLIDEYVNTHGLILIPGENALVAGISKMLNLLESGQVKVFNTLGNWLDEYRIYRYDRNDPNKIARNQADHLMDATRYLIMSGLDIMESVPDEDGDGDERYHPRHVIGRNPISGY